MKRIEKIEMTGFDRELKAELKMQGQMDDSDLGDGMVLYEDERMNKVARRCVGIYRTVKGRQDVTNVLKKHFKGIVKKLRSMPLIAVSMNAELLERELSAMGYKF